MFYTIPLVPLGTILLVIYVFYDLIKNRTNNLMQRIMLYTFIFYLLNIFDLTMGGIVIPPLSEDAGIQIQPVPFYFIADWARLYKINGADWFFWNSVKLTFYNFIMLAPFGIYTSLLLRIHDFKKAALLVFLTSLTIETCQLLFSYFGLILPRGFNVDDMIVNTAGGMIGFLLCIELKKLHLERKFYKIIK